MRCLFKLISEVLPNSAPVAPILRGGPSLEKEGGEKEKEGGEEEEEGKAPGWI